MEGFNEFIDHLEAGGLSLAKGGAHAHRLHRAHKAMADFHKTVHDSLDDDHEMKAFHRVSGDHHTECAEVYKALSTGGGDVPVGDLNGPSKSHKASDIVPDGVRVAGDIQRTTLVPRAGSNPGGPIAVDPGLEDMFSGV